MIFSSVRELIRPKARQIPLLDGVRSLAIFLVLINHVNIEYNLEHGASVDYLGAVAARCWVGVDIFFVLSGFLIGKILFAELATTDHLNVKRFLVMRALRIWPLYYFMCFSVMITYFFVKPILLNVHGIVVDLFFLSNYFTETLSRGGWSICIEEQFYLLLPFCLLMYKKSSTYFARKSLLRELAVLLCLCPLIRFFIIKIIPLGDLNLKDLFWGPLYFWLPARMDALLGGLILAGIWVFYPSNLNSLRQGAKFYWLYVAIILLICNCGFFLDSALFRFTYVSVLASTVLFVGLLNEEFFIVRFLSLPIWRILSRLSFGFYLWYRYPLPAIAKFIFQIESQQNPIVQWISIMAVTLTAGLLLSLTSFVLIESRFLVLRDRMRTWRNDELLDRSSW